MQATAINLVSPPSRSGINWVHDNAKSAEHFLPETLPPGCAIFDYDGDGWMDIFLVNTGESDFFAPKAPLRNALYKNNRDGTFGVGMCFSWMTYTFLVTENSAPTSASAT